MGWLIYDRSVSDPKAECDRIATWSNEESAGEVLASSIVGSTYYAAHRKTTHATGESKTVGIVFLIQRSPFGYKDMDESMGPCESECPRYILELLSPLPALEPQDCWHCEGAGVMNGPRWHVDAQGKPCSTCEGTGKTDRNAYARNWRKRCWSRFGGEPQGQQLELLA